MLAAAGIVPRRRRSFPTANQERLELEVGYAIVRGEGHETIDEVVFGEPTDLSLLGVRTLEVFGVMVDNLARRLVATTTLAV